MKKLALAFITVACALCLTATAFAGTLAPGASTTCKDAKSIKLESAGTHKFDRTNTNLVLFKSSNFTTVPISLGPSDTMNFPTGAAGNTKDSFFKCKDTTQCVPGAIDSAASGVREMSSKGRKSVTLGGQSNFSRGDSLGDISGEVRITNTGTVPGNVTCG